VSLSPFFSENCKPFDPSPTAGYQRSFFASAPSQQVCTQSPCWTPGFFSRQGENHPAFHWKSHLRSPNLWMYLAPSSRHTFSLRVGLTNTLGGRNITSSTRTYRPLWESTCSVTPELPNDLPCLAEPSPLPPLLQMSAGAYNPLFPSAVFVPPPPQASPFFVSFFRHLFFFLFLLSLTSVLLSRPLPSFPFRGDCTG